MTPHREGLGDPSARSRPDQPAIIILARPGAPAPPYARLLPGPGRELVVVSGPSPATAAAPAAGAVTRRGADGRAHDGHVRRVTVRHYASPETESAVLRYAEQAPVGGLVALDFDDLIRAGALRDHLGLPGMGREAALVYTDPALAAGHLERAGVPCVRRAPVQAPGDLYWLAHRWGYPLRVRSARVPGRPVAGVLHGEADLRRFTRDGAGADPAAFLVAEAWTAGDHYRACRPPGPDADWHWSPGPAPGLAEAAKAAAAALPAAPGYSRHLELVRTGGGWLVDLAGCAVERGCPVEPAPAEAGAAVLAQGAMDACPAGAGRSA
ncbi:hypothetical protein GCM10009716_10400 [Streptomyces sodiiphilus]|uniref:ATP-grasp domain-containing protein n=1 Tax=Streptomyces sodiiphilus TaxID=226217 RepID=A0ABN2NTW0_9ACTN